MSNNSKLHPTQPNDPISASRWSHLDEYERRYVQEIIIAYDEIMQVTDDVPIIASRYQLNVESVERAKDYPFGSGVSEHEFIPDINMAEAWNRIASGEGTDIDEIFLRHEIFESDLVVNQGMNQKDAHELAQARYPWSRLLKQQENQ